VSKRRTQTEIGLVSDKGGVEKKCVFQNLVSKSKARIGEGSAIRHTSGAERGAVTKPPPRKRKGKWGVTMCDPKRKWEGHKGGRHAPWGFGSVLKTKKKTRDLYREVVVLNTGKKGDWLESATKRTRTEKEYGCSATAKGESAQ